MRSAVTYCTGLVLGLALAWLLASLWVGESSRSGLEGVLAAPRALLIVPVLLGLALAWVPVRVGDLEEPVVLAGGFLVGSLLGVVAGAALLWLAPLPDRGVVVHLLGGLFFGGALGTAIPFLASRLAR